MPLANDVKRNTALFLLALATALVAALPDARAQYPSKPVRIVAPFPPGGGTDFFARGVAQKLGDALRQQFVVENRPGAAGMIGSDIAARAAPDGYTLLITSSSSHAINPHLTQKPLYDSLRDFAPIIQIASAPTILLVHPSVPARSVRDLIRLAKTQPGALNYASSGTGTLQHLIGELLKLDAGIDMVHIPYKGGPPALLGVVAGEASVLFAAVPTAVTQMRSGKLRALGVTSRTRNRVVADLPAISEVLPGFEAIQWWGMFGPAALPPDIVNRLNGEVTKILNVADMKERFATDGAEPVGGTPQEFAAFLKADFEKWGRLVKRTGIRSD